MSKYSAIPPAERLPDWLRRPIGNASELERVQGLVKQNRLHTICEEGRCPNRGECYAAGTATFLLGGSICTRSCAFCQVDKGQAPMPVDAAEAERVADEKDQDTVPENALDVEEGLEKAVLQDVDTKEQNPVLDILRN